MLRNTFVHGVLLSLVTVSCAPHVHETPVEDEGPPSVAVTVWSDVHEIFAEYTVPVVGEASRFATHVSVNATGLPRRSGPVTYRLEDADGEAFEVVDQAPARDGIYLTEVTYPRVGQWRLTLAVPGAVPGTGDPDVIDLGQVTVFATDAERAAAPEADEVDGISFLKEQQWLLETKTGLVSRSTLEERLSVPGRIRAAPHLSADVVPPVAGRLSPPTGQTLPALGTTVQAGQLLAWVQPPVSDALVAAVAAEAELARLEVDVSRAEAILERVVLLHEQEVRSTRELEEAEFAARSVRAARDGARRAVLSFAAAGITTSDGTEGGPPRFAIHAPLDGVVDSVLAVSGESVSVEAPILRLLDTSTVHVEAQVRAEQLPRIDTAAPVRLTLSSFGQPTVALPDGAARFVHLGLEIDEHTGRAPLVFAVHNPDTRWRPGLAVEVSLGTGRAEQTLAVPASALIEEDVSTVAYVQLGGETFERRVVTTGLVDGGFVEVLSGLAPGERVVIDGAYAVRLASVSTTEAAHGHAH